MLVLVRPHPPGGSVQMQVQSSSEVRSPLSGQPLLHCTLELASACPSARAGICHSRSSPLLESIDLGAGPKLDKQEPFASRQLRKPHFPLCCGSFLWQVPKIGLGVLGQLLVPGIWQKGWQEHWQLRGHKLKRSSNKENGLKNNATTGVRSNS